MMTQTFMTFIEINEKLIGLVKNERQLTHEILNHILLFQKCNGHLKLGYSSMHQYLTRGLGYSDDQAYRRLKAARLINELPEVANQLQAAKLNLSQMAEAQKAFETSERETKKPLNKEMKTALMANLEKANNFQTKSILSTELKLKPKIEEKINPQSDQTVRLELSLTKMQFEKLQTIKNLVSHQIPDLNTAKALEMVFDFFISKKQSTSVKTVKKTTPVSTQAFVLSPLKNREPMAIGKVHAKEVKKMTTSFMDSIKQSNKAELKNPMITPSQLGVKQSRYISVGVKKALFEKSKGFCEYVGSTGIRCNSLYQIQMDHYHQAFCFGGKNTIENLRHLCAQHNKLTATEKGIGFETTSHYHKSLPVATTRTTRM